MNDATMLQRLKALEMHNQEQDKRLHSLETRVRELERLVGVPVLSTKDEPQTAEPEPRAYVARQEFEREREIAPRANG